MQIRRILLPLAAALLPACSVMTGVENHEETFYIAPYTRPCQGMVPMQCMLVREDPRGEWLNFYDAIQGFTYEPGYSYTLVVGWHEIENPPADGSSRAYWLIRQVEKRPADDAVLAQP